MAIIAAHLNNMNQNQNVRPLTPILYIYQNVLHRIYYDNIYILPVGISVDVPGFNQPFIYFSEDYPYTDYPYNHTRALNNYVYYGGNNNEINRRRTLLLNYSNIANNILTGIRNHF